MPACVVYLLRHGETAWNREGRIQGSRDSPLTPLGQDQARRMGEALARRIRDLSGFTLQVSPLGRTVATASFVAGRLSLDAVYEQRLAEVSLGSWDGLTRVDVEARYAGVLAGASRKDWYFRSSDGESYEAALVRAKSWLADLTGPTIAITHGLIGRLIRGSYLGLSRQAMLNLPTSQGGVYCLSGRTAELLVDAGLKKVS